MARSKAPQARPLQKSGYPRIVHPVRHGAMRGEIPPGLGPGELLALARDRLPQLRAELEFWQYVLARDGDEAGRKRHRAKALAPPAAKPHRP